MGCAIIIRSPHSFQDQVHSHPSFFSSRAIRDPFYFNQSHLSLLLYLNSLNPEDHGASSWILVFPHLNRILGQRVRDGGHPSAVNHIVVVLFWHHSVQIPEQSFFFSQCNYWPKSQSLGVPNASHGRIKFFLSCSLILMYFLRIGTIFMVQNSEGTNVSPLPVSPSYSSLPGKIDLVDTSKHLFVSPSFYTDSGVLMHSLVP